MSENAVGRRQALRGAGIAAGGVAIAGLATATPAMAGNDNGLLGSWMCVRQDDGTTDMVRLVLSFAGGGVFVSHDISPAGPPFTGTWSSKGKSFRATFWTGFPGEQGPDSVGPDCPRAAEGHAVTRHDLGDLPGHRVRAGERDRGGGDGHRDADGTPDQRLTDDARAYDAWRRTP